MLLKRKDENGSTFYVNAFTGNTVKLRRETGRKTSYLPNYVRSFRKNQPYGDNQCRHIKFKRILKIKTDGNKFIIYQ